MYNQALGVCRGLAFWVMGWLLSGYEITKEEYDEWRYNYPKYDTDSECNRQINHRIALHPENVRKYKQKRSVRL